MLHTLFLLDMSIFNDLVFKNESVKKAKSFFAFMEEVQLHHQFTGSSLVKDVQRFGQLRHRYFKQETTKKQH